MLHDKDLIEIKGTIFRVLSLKDGKALVVDCRKKTMPYWVENSSLAKGLIIGESLFLEKMGKLTTEKEELSPDTLKIMHERYSLIAGVLPFIEDDKARNEAISRSADLWGVSKQTIRHYLCKYLVYQDENALAPKARKKTDLTKDQKHMRWALNKYYYTTRKNSLMTAYTMMLKERYCDGEGQLKENYPTFYQFRYFYRKTRNLRKYYISRGGIKDYQQNHRPLTGDGVQEYAPMPGTGMLDATVCDIYLVNDAGALVGRPILTACVDACTGLCCGYALGWDGGMSSVRNMLLNVVSNKNAWCRKFGIEISDDDWPSKELPAVLVTDMGREYCSYLLEQITDLGVKIVNLPAYRPELKGPVEKFFDLVQGLYKPQLKGKGVIAPDFQQRGAHDYRKDACLTLKQFEAIVLRCIVYYNSQQVMNYPYGQPKKYEI